MKIRACGEAEVIELIDRGFACEDFLFMEMTDAEFSLFPHLPLWWIYPAHRSAGCFVVRAYVAQMGKLGIRYEDTLR